MFVISLHHRRTFRKFPTLNACKKKKVIRWDGLLNYSLWRVSLNVLKINIIWLPWLFIKWESMKCSIPQSRRYLALTSHYSFVIHILTTWSCLVLLIVIVSQINWLYCHIFGIAKQALDFVRDEKSLCPRWKFSKKINTFVTTPPLENSLVHGLLCLGNLWRTKFLVTFDGFYHSESLSVDLMIKYTLCQDWQNTLIQHDISFCNTISLADGNCFLFDKLLPLYPGPPTPSVKDGGRWLLHTSLLPHWLKYGIDPLGKKEDYNDTDYQYFMFHYQNLR